MKNNFLILFLVLILFTIYECKEKKTKQKDKQTVDLTDKSKNTESINYTQPEIYKSDIDSNKYLYDIDLLNAEGNIKSVSISFYSADYNTGIAVKKEKMTDSLILRLGVNSYYFGYQIHKSNNFGLEYKRTFKKLKSGKLSEISKFYSDGSIKFVKYKYNKKGKITEKKQNIYLLDEKGNIKPSFTPEMQSPILNLTELNNYSSDTINTYYKYNRNGLLIEKINPIEPEVFMENSDYYEDLLYYNNNPDYIKYIYNKNKKIKETKCYDNAKKLIFTLKRKYDKKGNLIKVFIKNWGPEITFSYNKKNKKIGEDLTKYGYIRNGSSYDSTGKIICSYKTFEGIPAYTYYSYDTKGNLTNIFKDSGAGSIEQTFLNYNKYNKIILKIYLNYGEGSGIFKESSYKYDKKERLSEEDYVSFKNDTLFFNNTSYYYNNNNCLITDSFIFGYIKKKYKMEYLKKDYEDRVDNGLGGYAENKGDTIYNYVSSKWFNYKNGTNKKQLINPKINITIKYKYDSYGNWIEKDILNKDKIIIIERKLVYFK